jgi:hypothetical protein
MSNQKQQNIRTMTAILCTTLLGVSLLVTGCINTGEVKTPKSTQGYEPKRVYDADVSKVWKAANDVFDENRISVLSSDQASGRIQTDTIAGENLISIMGGGTMFRYSYNIRITSGDGGKTKLAIICKLESMHQIQNSTRPYMDVSPENPAKVKNYENWLYEQIEKKLGV